MNKHPVDDIEVARLAQAWASARYHVHAGDETVSFTVGSALIPFAVGETAAAVERRWLARRYLFITAFNPGSVTIPLRCNQRADALLQQHLQQLDLAMHHASASDTDGSWHESGWLVLQATPPQADRLARTFDQGDVLVWDAGQAVRLRMMWPKPAAAPVHGYIDWAG